MSRFGILFAAMAFAGLSLGAETAPKAEQRQILLDQRLVSDLSKLVVEGTLLLPGAEEIRIDAQAEVVWKSEATGEATLKFKDLASLKIQTAVSPGTGAESLNLEVRVTVDGKDLSNYRLERLSIRLPLYLEKQKRVIQAGENGLTWETRTPYFYFTPLHSKTKLLPEPDINIWRVFRSEWTAGDTYTLVRWESDSTAPFILHRGTGFPAWIGVYDQRGGIAAGLGEADFQRERALEVDTADKGTLIIDMHPATANPSPLEDDTLMIKLVSFKEPSEALGTALARTPAVSGPPAPRPNQSDVSLLPVSGGIPFAQGVLRPSEKIEVRTHEQAVHPLQTAPLAYWPDGSVKWMELTFPLDSKRTDKAAPPPEGALTTFEVNDANGGRQLFSVYPQKNVLPQSPSPLQITRSEENITVRTGALEATFTKGKNWWRSLRIGEQSVLTGENPVEAYLETITVDKPVAPGHGKPLGIFHRSILIAERVEVEEDGPLRAVLKVEGRTQGPYPCQIILRLAFFAGSAAIQGSHTWVVGDFDPRKVFVTGLGIDFTLPLNPRATEAVVEENGKQTPISLSEGVYLSAPHPDASEVHVRKDGMLERLQVGPLSNAVDLKGPAWGMAAALRDMRKMFPMGIGVAEGKNNVRFSLEFWPRSASPMDLRRYSDFPHRGQGETVTSTSNDWVNTHYYKEDPVRGISRTHEFLLLPWIQTQPSIQSLAVALEDRPLIYSGEQNYLKAGVLDYDLSDPSFLPVRKNLKNFADFLEYHRNKWRWFGKWTYGDIQHSFQRGYGRVIPSRILENILDKNPKELPKGAAISDYVTQNDWAADNGRWGWTNTEGLPNRFLSDLYLRTGDRQVFFAMEALAKQSRDIVIRHEGRWLGGGTRHGVQPWSDGCHQERMTIPSEYRLHRLLTGDKRSRDVLLRYGYDIFLQPKSTFIHGSAPLVREHADHSARLYGLLTLWEATGDPKVGDALRRYVSTFITPKGVAEDPTVKFPEIELVNPPQSINSGNMFFQTFGAMYALTEYAELTHNADLKKAICQMAQAALEDPKVNRLLAENGPNSAYFFWPALAFAARYADDAERYRDFISTWASGPGAVTVRQIVTQNPAHWSGPTGHLFGNFMSGVLYRMNTLPSLMAPLGKLGALDPNYEKQIEQREREGHPRPAVRPSWQDDYESHSKLLDYLHSKNQQSGSDLPALDNE